MKIGYALMLNDETHNFLRKVQLDLHQQTSTGLARQPPHITIKSPFDTDEIEPHLEYLEQLSREIRPFEVTFDRFDFFGEKVIFLNVAENEALHHFHRKILREVKARFDLAPHEFEGANIRFHASVAGFDDPEKFNAARKYLDRYTPRFKFIARTLGLFYYLGPEKGWIVNRKISLTEKSSDN